MLVFVDYEPTVIGPERVIREIRHSIGFGHPDVIALDPDQVGRILVGGSQMASKAPDPPDLPPVAG
jgi:hypothetical protein